MAYKDRFRFIVMRDVELNMGIENARDIVLRVLSALRASVRIVLGNVIRAEHGTNWTLSPEDIKKEISIEFNTRNGGTLVRVVIDYHKYMVISLISDIIGLLIGFMLLMLSTAALAYLESIASGETYALFAKPPLLYELLKPYISNPIDAAYIFTQVMYIGVMFLIASIADIAFKLSYIPVYMARFADKIVLQLRCGIGSGG